jgi:hypothetical protein
MREAGISGTFSKDFMKTELETLLLILVAVLLLNGCIARVEYGKKECELRARDRAQLANLLEQIE